MDIERIGVIGAGQMGTGIAQILAQAGYSVVLEDVAEDQLTASLTNIRNTLKHMVDDDMIGDTEAEAVLARIKTVKCLNDLPECDMVIETATEDETIKREIFSTLCPLLPERTLIATNTSSSSITRLASATDRPGKFIGMHFMKPVEKMKLVEIVRGIATEDETFQAALDIVQRLGKTPAHAEDFPAFIVDRILLPMINEAVYTLYEGVGTVEAIDTAMKLGAGHPMGPLALADFLGLDTVLSIMQVLYDGLADSKYRPCPLLVKYVEAGWLGRKTGRGFYDYHGDHPVPTR